MRKRQQPSRYQLERAGARAKFAAMGTKISNIVRRGRLPGWSEEPTRGACASCSAGNEPGARVRLFVHTNEGERSEPICVHCLGQVIRGLITKQEEEKAR